MAIYRKGVGFTPSDRATALAMATNKNFDLAAYSYATNYNGDDGNSFITLLQRMYDADETPTIDKFKDYISGGTRYWSYWADLATDKELEAISPDVDENGLVSFKKYVYNPDGSIKQNYNPDLKNDDGTTGGFEAVKEEVKITPRERLRLQLEGEIESQTYEHNLWVAEKAKADLGGWARAGYGTLAALGKAGMGMLDFANNLLAFTWMPVAGAIAAAQGKVNSVDEFFTRGFQSEAFRFFKFCMGGTNEGFEHFLENYTDFKNVDGTSTFAGDLVLGAADTMGRMIIPTLLTMGIGAGMGAAGAATTTISKATNAFSTLTFYSSYFAGGVKEMKDLQDDGVNIPDWGILLKQAFETSTEIAIERGLDKLLGATGIENLVFGRKTGEGLSKQIINQNWNAFAQWIGKGTLDAFHEALEEGLQEITDGIISNVFNVCNAQFKATGEFSWEAVGQSALIGAITSAFGTTINLAKANIGSYKVGDAKIKKHTSIDIEYEQKKDGTKGKRIYRNIEGQIIDKDGKVAEKQDIKIIKETRKMNIFEVAMAQAQSQNVAQALGEVQDMLNEIEFDKLVDDYRNNKIDAKTFRDTVAPYVSLVRVAAVEAFVLSNYYGTLGTEGVKVLNDTLKAFEKAARIKRGTDDTIIALEKLSKKEAGNRSFIITTFKNSENKVLAAIADLLPENINLAHAHRLAQRIKDADIGGRAVVIDGKKITDMRQLRDIKNKETLTEKTDVTPTIAETPNETSDEILNLDQSKELNQNEEFDTIEPDNFALDDDTLNVVDGIINDNLLVKENCKIDCVVLTDEGSEPIIYRPENNEKAILVCSRKDIAKYDGTQIAQIAAQQTLTEMFANDTIPGVKVKNLIYYYKLYDITSLGKTNAELTTLTITNFLFNTEFMKSMIVSGNKDVVNFYKFLVSKGPENLINIDGKISESLLNELKEQYANVLIDMYTRFDFLNINRLKLDLGNNNYEVSYATADGTKYKINIVNVIINKRERKANLFKNIVLNIAKPAVMVKADLMTFANENFEGRTLTDVITFINAITSSTNNLRLSLTYIRAELDSIFKKIYTRDDNYLEEYSIANICFNKFLRDNGATLNSSKLQDYIEKFNKEQTTFEASALSDNIVIVYPVEKMITNGSLWEFEPLLLTKVQKFDVNSFIKSDYQNSSIDIDDIIRNPDLLSNKTLNAIRKKYKLTSNEKITPLNVIRFLDNESQKSNLTICLNQNNEYVAVKFQMLDFKNKGLTYKQNGKSFFRSFETIIDKIFNKLGIDENELKDIFTNKTPENYAKLMKINESLKNSRILYKEIMPFTENTLLGETPVNFGFTVTDNPTNYESSASGGYADVYHSGNGTGYIFVNLAWLFTYEDGIDYIMQVFVHEGTHVTQFINNLYNGINYNFFLDDRDNVLPIFKQFINDAKEWYADEFGIPSDSLDDITVCKLIYAATSGEMYARGFKINAPWTPHKFDYFYLANMFNIEYAPVKGLISITTPWGKKYSFGRDTFGNFIALRDKLKDNPIWEKNLTGTKTAAKVILKLNTGTDNDISSFPAGSNIDDIIAKVAGSMLMDGAKNANISCSKSGDVIMVDVSFIYDYSYVYNPIKRLAVGFSAIDDVSKTSEVKTETETETEMKKPKQVLKRTVATKERKEIFKKAEFKERMIRAIRAKRYTPEEREAAKIKLEGLKKGRQLIEEVDRLESENADYQKKIAKLQNDRHDAQIELNTINKKLSANKSFKEREEFKKQIAPLNEKVEKLNKRLTAVKKQLEGKLSKDKRTKLENKLKALNRMHTLAIQERQKMGQKERKYISKYAKNKNEMMRDLYTAQIDKINSQIEHANKKITANENRIAEINKTKVYTGRTVGYYLKMSSPLEAIDTSIEIQSLKAGTYDYWEDIQRQENKKLIEKNKTTQKARAGWNFGFGKTRWLSEEEVKGTNLEYWANKKTLTGKKKKIQVDVRLQNLIVGADLEQIDYRIADKIRSGELTYFTIVDIIRNLDVQPINEYTFNAITATIPQFQNPFIDTLDDLKFLVDNMGGLWALAVVYKNKPNIVSAIKSVKQLKKLLTEVQDKNHPDNKMYKKAIMVYGMYGIGNKNTLIDKSEEAIASAVTKGQPVTTRNAETFLRVLRLYNGSIDSIADIATSLVALAVRQEGLAYGGKKKYNRSGEVSESGSLNTKLGEDEDTEAGELVADEKAQKEFEAVEDASIPEMRKFVIQHEIEAARAKAEEEGSELSYAAASRIMFRINEEMDDDEIRDAYIKINMLYETGVDATNMAVEEIKGENTSSRSPANVALNAERKWKRVLATLKATHNEKILKQLIQDNSDILDKDGNLITDTMYTKNEQAARKKGKIVKEYKDIKAIIAIEKRVSDILYSLRQAIAGKKEELKELEMLKRANENLKEQLAKEHARKENTNDFVKTEKTTKVRDNGFKYIAAGNSEMPEKLKGILGNWLTDTVKSKIKNLSAENDAHTQANYKKFFDINAELLADLTQADIDAIIDFYTNISGDTFDVESTQALYTWTKLVLFEYFANLARRGRITLAEDTLNNMKAITAQTITTAAQILGLQSHIKFNFDPMVAITEAVFKQEGIIINPEKALALVVATDKVVQVAADYAKGNVTEQALEAVTNNLQRQYDDLRITAIEDNQASKKSVWDKLYRIQRLAMLSGPGTMLRNGVSDVALKFGNRLADKIGAIFAKIPFVKKFIDKGTADQFQYNFTTNASTEATEMANSAFIEQLYTMISDGLLKQDTKRLSDMEGTKALAHIMRDAIRTKVFHENEYAGKGEKFFKWWASIVQKGMSDDRFIKSDFKRYLAKFLTQRWDELQNTELNLSLTANSVLQEIIVDAYVQAANDYQHQPNFVLKMEQAIKQYGGSPAYFMYKQIIPFASASWNWFVEALKWTPLGLAKAAKDIITLEKTIDYRSARVESLKGGIPTARSTTAIVLRNFGKGVVGTTLAVFGALLAMAGFARIDKDDNDKIKLKIGDLWIDVSNVTGSSGFLFGLALFSQDNENAWQASLKAFSLMFDEFILMQIQNNVRGLQDDKWLNTILANELRMFTPAIIRNVARVTNPSKVTYDAAWYKFAEKELGDLGPLSHLLPKEIDPYTGNWSHRYSPWILFDAINQLSPIKFARYSLSDTEDEAIRLGIRKGQIGVGKVGIGNGQEIKLTAKQTQDLNEIYGLLNSNTLPALINNQIKYKILDDKTNTYKEIYYRQMTDEQKKSAIERIMSNNAMYAKVSYFTDRGYKYYATEETYNKLKKLNIYKNVYKKIGKLEGFVAS